MLLITWNFEIFCLIQIFFLRNGCLEILNRVSKILNNKKLVCDLYEDC